MLILNAQEVEKALPMAHAIEAMRAAFAALCDGRAVVPLRAHLSVAPFNGTTLVMPGFVDEGDAHALAVKVVSLFPDNLKRDLAMIQAGVLVLDPGTGQVAALLEGASLTAIRTGAASGLATDLLARPDSRQAAIFGAGVQARTQLEAVCTVRQIETVWVYCPFPEQTQAFIRAMSGRGPMPSDIRAAATPSEAVSQADIICTATTADTPVFDDADLKAGAHINAIGSYKPEVCEVPLATVARSGIFVDNREAALAESGELIQSIDQGLIKPDHVLAELGELVLQKKAGRRDANQVTLYKGVGIAVQDAVSARFALANAKKLGLGTEVDF